jgi:hypothetical protein
MEFTFSKRNILFVNFSLKKIGLTLFSLTILLGAVVQFLFGVCEGGGVDGLGLDGGRFFPPFFTGTSVNGFFGSLLIFFSFLFFIFNW